MSLYDQDGGSIWSSGSIFFSSQSAINEILERDDFTLHDIFAEDDLLQELKGLNVKLLEYMSSVKVLETIITYFTKADAVEGDDILQKRRYPFTACEVRVYSLSCDESNPSVYVYDSWLSRLRSFVFLSCE